MRIVLGSPADVDNEVEAWLRRAFAAYAYALPETAFAAWSGLRYSRDGNRAAGGRQERKGR